MNFIEYMRQQINWSRETFGPDKRKKGVIDHIRKELKELEDVEDPASELSEWIDVIILASDGAWRAGFTPEQVAKALFDKQTKNINRVWPDWRTMSEDQAIEHDRTVEPLPPLPYICAACKVQQLDPTKCANCGKRTLFPNRAYCAQYCPVDHAGMSHLPLE